VSALSREIFGISFRMVLGRYSEQEIDQKVEQLREQLLTAKESENNQEL